jgi:glycosyltransferase involved in cell wall biosynthesis
MRVCYVIGTYPLVTTTFVDREVRSLQRLGVDIRLLAVRRPPLDAPLSNDQRHLQDSVQYILPLSLSQLLVAHAYFALRQPRQYLGTLAWLVSRQHPDLRARGKTLLHFGEGAHAAWLLRGQEFDALHAHFADRAATIALVAARLLGVRYSLSVHAGADIFVTPVLLPEKVRGAGRVITCTACNKARLTDVVGIDVSSKIHVVPHGIDVDRFQPRPSAKSARPVVLAVGQFRERKGFDYLIAACRRLRAEGAAFTCRIIGDGPQYDAMASLVRMWQLEDVVQLPGAVANDDLVHEYEGAEMFVLPCVEADNGDVDGIPNALIEAMACGLPVVSTRLPAIREVVTSEQDGLLVRPRDVDTLACALRRVLESRALRERLGKQGRATVAARFEADHSAQRFAAALWPDQVGELVPARAER